MPGRMICRLSVSAAITVFIAVLPSIVSAEQQGSSQGACALLSPAEIAMATGIMVGTGTAGPAVPGTLGRCTWPGSGDTKVIVTLTDAQHMQTTVAAQERTGTDIPGVGSKAVGVRGASFTGGGYIISILDAKGGFGVSILGKDGTKDRAVALAKIVESHR